MEQVHEVQTDRSMLKSFCNYSATAAGTQSCFKVLGGECGSGLTAGTARIMDRG